jgi:hypothetical protein
MNAPAPLEIMIALGAAAIVVLAILTVLVRRLCRELLAGEPK